jgi:hypothetical protein
MLLNFSALSIKCLSVTSSFPHRSRNSSLLLILYKKSHLRYGKAYKFSISRFKVDTMLVITSSVSPTHLVRSYIKRTLYQMFEIC